MFLRFSLVSILFFPTLLCAEERSHVRLDGSSTVYPIAEAAAEDFQSQNPKIRITVGESGSGGGFKKLLAKEIDIANASRKIKKEELATAKANGIEILEVEIAQDGIAVMVHPSNNIDIITMAQLKKIWEPQSKVEYWSDVDPKWPKNKIHLYGPGSDSGTFEFFTEQIVGKARASRAKYTASEDDNVLVTGLSQDKDGLGYFGLAYYLENQKKLKAVRVGTSEKDAIGPSLKSVENGSYKPLSRPLFMYITKSGAKNPDTIKFLKYFFANAQNLVTHVGYVPLGKNEYSAAYEKIEKWAK